MWRTATWAGSVLSLLALSSSCGDDGATTQPGGGGDAGAGNESAGMPGAAAGGGETAAGGSSAMADAGDASAGMPMGNAGMPMGNAGMPMGDAGMPGASGSGGTGDEGVVATTQDAPKGIAVDANRVYWANSGTGKIVSCPLAGCGDDEPTVIVEGATGARGIAVDATSVYWMSDPDAGGQSSIKKCSLAGCDGQPTVLGDVNSVRPNDVHVVGTQLIYTAWPDFSYCTTSDCSQGARLSIGNMPIVSVDTDAEYVYFSRHGNEIISRCERYDCATIVDLATNQRAISIAVDSTTLYFAKLAPLAHGAVDDPGIYSCPLDGCGEDAPGVVLPGVHAYAIALSPTRVYYTDVDAGIVASIPK